MSAAIRVLVVDDSAFARKVVREILQAAGFEVVGTARDGLEALEQISDLKPDVITLDLVMPNLDGLGVLQALHTLPAGTAPRVIVVSVSGSTTGLGVAALQAGAVNIVHKPTSLATAQLYELKAALLRAVREAMLGRAVVPLPLQPAATEHAVPVPLGASPARHTQPLTSAPTAHKLVVIGTSTGGPQALTRLLTALPGDFPVPLAIALHIPAGYTEELAKRLDRACAIDVVHAAEGLELRPGLAVLARGGEHLTISPMRNGLYAQLAFQPVGEQHAPSVDVLFESAAARLGAAVLVVVLTGMGSDGLRGSRAIHAAGGHILTEAESSCVVYGMPGVVKDAGLSQAEAALDDMARLIARSL